VVSLLLASHPVPGAAVTVVTAVLAAAVGLDLRRIAVLVLVMAADQLAVGWSNDAIDADRDRVAARADKPIATGRIERRTVALAAVVSGAAALAGAFVLGVPAGGWHAVFFLSALAYNAGLKRTVFSVVPYLLSFGLLPVLVAASAEPARTAAPWAMGAGALLGVAAHFANVLPDLDDDERTGVRGLPHRLGARATGVLAFVALLAAAALVATGAPSLETAAALIAVEVLSVLGVLLVLRRRFGRILFVLILVSAVALVVGLSFAGSSISTTA
jgi:4-hydroxybenzoate polyprenyltransferase